MNVLYEILVPTIYGDTMTPIRTRHHKEWDKYVQNITGGLTILSAAKGKWTHEGVEYPEKVIPVRVMVIETDYAMSYIGGDFKTTKGTYQIDKIIQFTIKHYRQKAVMHYVVSDKVFITYADTR